MPSNMLHFGLVGGAAPAEHACPGCRLWLPVHAGSSPPGPDSCSGLLNTKSALLSASACTNAGTAANQTPSTLQNCAAYLVLPATSLVLPATEVLLLLLGGADGTTFQPEYVGHGGQRISLHRLQLDPRLLDLHSTCKSVSAATCWSPASCCL